MSVLMLPGQLWLARYAAVPLLLLTAGCASVASAPEAPQPPVVATQPATPQTAATPVAPAETPPAPNPAATPVTSATSPATPRVTPAAQPAAPRTAATPAAPAKTAPAPRTAATPVTPAAPRVATPPASATPAVVAAPTTPPALLPLDLDALEARLRATKAIGVFTKISLKNQVDDLMKQFRDHYAGKVTRTMSELRRSYDLLIMKVLSLLQDSDQMLASAIVSSREAIWGLLSDQSTFANL